MGNSSKQSSEGTGDVARRLALYRQAVERAAIAGMPAAKVRLLDRIMAGIDRQGGASKVPGSTHSNDQEESLMNPTELALEDTMKRLEGPSPETFDDLINEIRRMGLELGVNEAKRGA